MVDFLEAIRSAVAPDATADARAAGTAACRAVLTALEATAGEPLAPQAPVPSSPVAAIVSSLRGVPADQLFDLLIAKVRSLLPPGTQVAPVAPFKFVQVPIPHRG
jgi:hypothetical protein